MVDGGRLSIPSAAAWLVTKDRATATPTITFFIPGFLWSGTQHAKAACSAEVLFVKRGTKQLAQDWAARTFWVQELRSNCKRDRNRRLLFRYNAAIEPL
jgi:hypothetical protein